MVADDQQEVEQVAHEFVNRQATGAVADLRAEQAEAIGDTFSAGIWREVADTAERIACSG